MIVEDFPLTCRVCLKKKDLHFLIPLTLQIENICILELIASCSSISIGINNCSQLPKKICHQCLEQLKIAKEIKEKCIESQEILKKFIVPTKEPTEKLVFIDVVKQELKNEEEDRYRQCTIVELPSPDLELQIPEFDKLFVDSFACDSHDSESEFFVPFTKKTVDTFRRKQMKIVIPRIDPFSFDNPNEKNFICDKCGEEFLNRTSFLAHYRKAHKRLRINQCKICMQSFQFSNGLKVHQKYHENQKDFACHLCPRRYVLKNELQKHVKTHQCEDLAICAGCGKAYSSHYLKNHKPNCKRDASRDEIIRAVSDMKIEYSCDFCDMKIFGKAFLAVHMKRTHLVQSSQSDFECPSCDKVFKSRYDRNLHNRQVHRKKKGVSCEYCGRMFVKLRMLEIHQKSQACAVNHSKCEICQRVFKTKSGFENHQKKCTNEKIEERKFRKPKQIKEWICEFCGKYLTTQPGHRRHLIARHKDVMYTKPPTTHPCPHCHKVFYFKTDLKNHVVCKHLKLRNFKCELCPKGYAVASGLRRHVKRVHNRTQEEDDKRKKFICHFCPAKYENDKALSKHLMHHDLSLPDRPFHCLECTRSFLTKKHMNAHMRIKHST